ncbi:MAG TPA: NADH-quinone oxidoreductase subunit I [Povalibacter sp.]
MKKRYWNEPEMGLHERIYFIEIARGLGITFGVFFRNMWKWLTFRKGALTAYYPEEIRSDYSPNNRGRHVLTLRPNGEVQCVSCNMCATACPAYCIDIQSTADFADPAHPKSPDRFEIDYSRCIFCGYCVEACPEDAIRMVKDTPNLPSFDRNDMSGKIDLLAHWRPTSDPRKSYPTPATTATHSVRPLDPTPPASSVTQPSRALP